MEKRKALYHKMLTQLWMGKARESRNHQITAMSESFLWDF